MMRAVQKALLAYLRAQPGLERVYDERPEAVVYPYVAFGRTTVQPIGCVGAEVTELTLNLMCVSRFGGTEEAKGLAEAVRAALDEAELALDAGRLANLRVSFVDVFRAADLRTVYGLVRVRAVVEAEE